jgi:hypothetical protein
MSDLEIARAATLEPIEIVGARIGLPESALYRYGPNKAKVSLDHIAKLGPGVRRVGITVAAAVLEPPARLRPVPGRRAQAHLRQHRRELLAVHVASLVWFT